MSDLDKPSPDFGLELDPFSQRNLDETVTKIANALGTIGLNQANLHVLRKYDLDNRFFFDPEEISELILQSEINIQDLQTEAIRVVRDAHIAQLEEKIKKNS
jgi:hypothetical protein